MEESEMFKQFKERDKNFWDGVAIAKKIYKRNMAEEIMKTIKIRENKAHIGTLARIYSYCNKFTKSKIGE